MIPVPLALSRCEEVADHLSEYLDGELGPVAAQRVEVHLATCAGCARLAADLAGVVAALHRLNWRTSRVSRTGNAGKAGAT